MMPVQPRAAIGLLLAVSTMPLCAQDFSPLSASAAGLGQAISQSHAVTDVMRSAYGKPNSPAQAHTSSGFKPSASAQLDYQPTPQEAHTALDAYIARVRQTNPSAADTAAREFARYDADKIFRTIIAPTGLRDNNVADVFTAYTILGWMIATGAGDPAPASVHAARDQFAARFMAEPQLTQAGPASLGEELKLLFVTLHAGWQSARREGKVQEYSDGVTAMFAKQGIDLRSMQLTPEGLNKR